MVRVGGRKGVEKVRSCLYLSPYFWALPLSIPSIIVFRKNSLEAEQPIAPFWLLSLTGSPLSTGCLFALLEAGEIWLLRNEHRRH